MASVVAAALLLIMANCCSVCGAFSTPNGQEAIITTMARRVWLQKVAAATATTATFANLVLPIEYAFANPIDEQSPSTVTTTTPEYRVKFAISYSMHYCCYFELMLM